MSKVTTLDIIQFEQMIFHALAEQYIGESKAAELMNMPLESFRSLRAMERHSHLTQFGLISKTMSGDLIAEAYKLRQKYIKTSVNDLLALTLAKHEVCQLLTGDKALRSVAKELNIAVRGTIWLVEQMLQRKQITIGIARVSFQRMKGPGKDSRIIQALKARKTTLCVDTL
jgi:predicted nucleic acid-binding protein